MQSHVHFLVALVLPWHPPTGGHFTKLGASQTLQQQSAGTSSPQIKTYQDHTADIQEHDPEQDKVNKIMADPETRKILMDLEVQELIRMLRENPSQAQRYWWGCYTH